MTWTCSDSVDSSSVVGSGGVEAKVIETTPTDCFFVVAVVDGGSVGDGGEIWRSVGGGSGGARQVPKRRCFWCSGGGRMRWMGGSRSASPIVSADRDPELWRSR